MRLAILVSLVCWAGVAACCVFSGSDDPRQPQPSEPVEPILERLSEQALTVPDLMLLAASPPDELRAAALDAPAPAADAIVQRLTPAARADLPSLPLTCAWRTRPLTGRPWVCAWVTQPVPTYVNGDPTRPNRPTALLVSFKRPASTGGFPIPGGRGGHLQVGPDYVFLPNRVPFLTQDQHGQIRLTITVPEQLAGLQVWFQLLVGDDRVPARAVPTDAVHVTFGNR